MHTFLKVLLLCITTDPVLLEYFQSILIISIIAVFALHYLIYLIAAIAQSCSIKDKQITIKSIHIFGWH